MTATKHKSRFRDPNKVTLSSAKWKKEVGTKPFCEGRQEFSMSDSAKLQMEDVMLKDPKRQNNQEDFQSYRSSIWGTFMAIVVVGNVDDPPPRQNQHQRGGYWINVSFRDDPTCFVQVRPRGPDYCSSKLAAQLHCLIINTWCCPWCWSCRQICS